MIVMDFARICRICLQLSNEMHNIAHKSQSLPDTYLQMLRDCTRLQISDNDNLPNQICIGCIKSLEISFNFNILCDKSNKLLSLYIEDSNKSLIKLKNENNHNLSTEQVTKPLVNFFLDIKDEPNDIYDSHHWDDDDDIVLQNIKQYNDTASEISGDEDKNLDFVFDDATENKKKVKKKRGRPKKNVVTLHQCDICGKILSSSSNLTVHKQTHNGISPYKCKFCTASYRGHSSLRKHMTKHTGIIDKITCDVCSKDFSCNNSLKTHMRIHSGEKNFKCEVCLKSFTQKCQLMIHSKRHTKERPFLCQVCGKGFAVQSELTVHERVHSGEKPYACNLCPKTFASHGNLAVHLRIHRKEIRYTCDICQRGFVTHHSYSLHVKRHKGIRNYVCECGKAFYTLSLLKQHKIVHTRERMYQCKLCLKEFIQSSHCNRHYKKEHLKPGMMLPPSIQFRVVINKKTRPTNITNDVTLQERVFQDNGSV